MDSSKEVWFVVVFAIIIGATLSIGLIVFFVNAIRFRRKLYIEQIRHAREIEAVQKEILRQSLEEISRELHDDFAQRLAMIHLQLNAILLGHARDFRESLTETKDATAQLLGDLRSLTHYLHLNSSVEIQLPEVIKEELGRVTRLGLLATTLGLEGVPRTFDNKTNLILFRIFQESLNNILAHSRARNCDVELCYRHDHLYFRIADDGIGLPTASSEPARTKGIGLKNMVDRSKLIDAHFQIDSAPFRGTSIEINIPYPSSKQNENGTSHPSHRHRRRSSAIPQRHHRADREVHGH